MASPSIGIGLLGMGVVGGGVAKAVFEKQQGIESRIGRPISIEGILVRDANKPRSFDVPSGLITTSFKDIVKFITAFTLGHSVTLILATFMKVTANYFLIDAIIALTVFYKGFDNIDGFAKYLQVKSPNLLKLVFAFGLIHGFGLSTRLQQLPLGHDGLLLKIISFNAGVECGQILALTAMLFLRAAKIIRHS